MIRDKENFLFAEWKSKVARDSEAVFVADGIVNEEVWYETKTKVLYLLKEVNGGDQEWDERDYLLKYNSNLDYIKTHSPTINVLTQWQYGMNYGTDRTWLEVEKDTSDWNVQSELLSQICLVNIKKTAGGSVVDWSKFDPYFKNMENRNYLEKQLSLYNPNVVICGGTAWLLCEIKGWKYSEWNRTSKGVQYYIDSGVVYIDFCHPNIRAPKNFLYYALVDAWKEITETIHK